MNSQEVFIVSTNSQDTVHRSRRELAKAILGNGISSGTTIIRYERGPSNSFNEDMAPELREWLLELPNYIMANAQDRKDMADYIEEKIDSLLR